MKVKIIKDYNDLQLKKFVVEDDVLEVSDERAQTLISAGVAVVAIDEPGENSAETIETDSDIGENSDETEPESEADSEEEPKAKSKSRSKGKKEA